MRMPRFSRVVLVGALVLLLSDCASVMSRATSQVANNLSNEILDQDDPGTVKDGVPAYLLLIGSLIAGDPDNADLLLAGAKLYGAYAGGFVEDPERGKRLAARAYGYTRRAVCLREKTFCVQLDAPFETFQTALNQQGIKSVPLLYGFASAWAGKIQVDSGNWNAIADIPKVQAILERIVALDDHYEDGGAYLYLGVLNSIRPASLGGKPEDGKKYFEKALELSGGKNQMVRVLYAEHYARLVFDKDLHDKLLNDAISADPYAPHLTLVNVLAQRRAKQLLESGKDYF
ncbi:hypothetical protein ELE36_09935 [Pseudolysobacter antarcticus]|uniref:Uncharacterized protein n=1 Tax=Pseudolysobacter antarcticus TaxID=2511995 RepID=A0A411HJI2_9GAMM|nr:TRAP transporter TatT component family protein [Pseudolysobacter antarcticus]QBB70658.1 hypothetical protein ELE36_09935 [Pseudolysobacter antarcticus]